MALIAEAEKLSAAEFLGDGLDLAGGDTLDIHFGKSRDQGLLRALVSLEELGGEAAVAVPGDAQFQLAHSSDKRAGIVAGPISETGLGPFTWFRAESVSHLRFQDLLHHFAHQVANEILIFGHEGFQTGVRCSTLLLGHGVRPFEG